MKQFRIAILMALSMVVCGSALATEKQFASPDGNLVVTVNDEGGTLISPRFPICNIYERM